MSRLHYFRFVYCYGVPSFCSLFLAKRERLSPDRDCLGEAEPTHEGTGLPVWDASNEGLEQSDDYQDHEPAEESVQKVKTDTNENLQTPLGSSSGRARVTDRRR